MEGNRVQWQIPFGLLGLLLLVAACGGGGDEDDTSYSYNPLWIYIDMQNLDVVTTTSQVALYGSAYCDACPPSEGAFGFCPDIQGPQSSSVTVSWANLKTGATGPAYNAITGSCSCLFSSCMSVYGNHWGAYNVPLAIGENVIEVRASDGANAATDTVSITRTPAAAQELAATAGKGEVTLQWGSVADATSFNLYWSTSPGFTKATAARITGVASPYLHTGLTDNVTYYYAVSAVNGAYESSLSSIAQATPGWQAEIIAATTPTTDQRGTSIALDASGNVHSHYAFNECTHYTTEGWFTYCDSHSYHNSYLTNATGAWTSQVLDASSDSDANIAVDGDGTVHVGYAAFQGVNHAVRVAGAWAAEVVDAQGWCDSSLAIDSANNVHLAYYGNSTSAGGLRYATNASGAWVQETVDLFDTGCSGQPGSLSLTVGTDGTPHVAYAGRSPDYGLKYAVKTGGAWNIDTVDSGGYIPNLSSAVDPAGAVHIAYTDNYNYLKYAHQDGTGNWLIETIDSGNSPAPSIALDAAGRVHISYVALHQLKYAMNAGSTWSNFILDGDAHSDTALAVDSLGKVHISYFSGGNLKYITNR